MGFQMDGSELSRIGLIGHGAIGHEITSALETLGETSRLSGVLVRPRRIAPCAVHDVAALIESRPDMVLECAGHGAVVEFVPVLLMAGIDVVISSIGALADEALADTIVRAERGGGRALLPSGAIAGLDGLVAARLAGIDRLTYISYKPPHAWRGTPAEESIDLEHEEPEVVFFEGSAREAALLYPKNANVAVAVALCGLGLEATQVQLVSSRKVTDPLGRIQAEGAFGHFDFEIFARASASNPKTSALTAYSLLQCARIGGALPVSALRKINETQAPTTLT